MARCQAFTLSYLADLIAVPFALRVPAGFDAESPNGLDRRWTCPNVATGQKRQHVAYCSATELTKQPLLKGQWRFDRLLCIGAPGIGRRGRTAGALRKVTCEETC